MPDHDWLGELNENDQQKIIALVRSFATPDDLQSFIKTSQETHREQERRAWAWDMVKKFAAALILIGGAIAAAKNIITSEWFHRP